MQVLDLAYLVALVVLIYVIYGEYKEGGEMKHVMMLLGVLVVNVLVWMAKKKAKKDLELCEKDLHACDAVVKRMIDGDKKRA